MSKARHDTRRNPSSRKRNRPSRNAPIRRVARIPDLRPRLKHAHKGDFGRVLVIGGSRGMIGAPALVANAALRSGAGLVTVACPASIQQAVATLCPCATTIPLAETKDGLIDPVKALKYFDTAAMLGGDSAPTVLAAGPGLGQGPPRFDRCWVELFRAFAQQASIPTVLDADALNAIARTRNEMTGRVGTNCVITPHPGEMARLRGISTASVQKNRGKVAVAAARWLADGGDHANKGDPPVVILKGADTVVTDGLRIYTNKTGNPGMATGGSGDALTGVIAALIGQGISRFDAAVLGVHVHGRAGDLAAKEIGELSLVATDLIDYLPRAFR